MNRLYITPNDPDVKSGSDSESINNAVRLAKELLINKVLIPRVNERTGKPIWETDSAIILPSDIEIILDNCYIRQMDGSMDNIFRNFEEDKITHTVEEESRGIIIRGVGSATLDGGSPNGLTQKTSSKNGFPHVERNNLILFHNLKDFTLENFSLINQRWWAINLHYCEGGVISGLKIMSFGTLHNQDGIDIRVGCKRILIKDCKGQTGDDFIALTGFDSKTAERYAVEGKSIDISNIVIRDILATSHECTVVALRCDDGVKIHDVTIDTVMNVTESNELSVPNPNLFGFDNNSYETSKSPYSLIRIGQEGYTSKEHQAMGDVYGITVRNIHATCNSAVMINCNLMDSVFSEIHAGKRCDRVVTTRSCRTHQAYGANLKNVMFEKIFYSPDPDVDSLAFDFTENQSKHTLSRVVIKDCFVDGARELLRLESFGEVTIDGKTYSKE